MTSYTLDWDCLNFSYSTLDGVSRAWSLLMTLGSPTHRYVTEHIQIQTVVSFNITRAQLALRSLLNQRVTGVMRHNKVETLKPVYTIQPVVKTVVQLVWQPAVSCKQTSNRLSNRLSNGFDSRFDNGFNNRLYRVYKHLPGLTTHWQQVVSCKRGLIHRQYHRNWCLLNKLSRLRSKHNSGSVLAQLQ